MTFSRIVQCLSFAASVLALSACATYSSNLADFREAYGSAEYLLADQEINELIADENGLSPDEVAFSDGLSPEIDPADGNTSLFLAEKAMVLLAQGHVEAATQLLRRARDQFDQNETKGVDDFLGAVALDDEVYDYPAHDYERIMVRVLLALCDLISGQGDAYAYALQVGEKQEAILNSDFGADQDYQPRQQYRRVAIGAYLQGLMLESTFADSDARKAYQRVVEYDPAIELGHDALGRLEGGRYADQGYGVLHVFYLVGRGPHLVEGYDRPSTTAIRLAQLAAVIATDSIVPFFQTDIPVPVVAIRDQRPPLLEMRSVDGEARTETLLDVNQVAVQQLDAMMPYIQARALLRRAVKAGVTTAGAEIASHYDSDNGGLYQLLGALTNLVMTSTENADTRNWSALPAEIQVARLELREGEHRVEFSDGMGADLRVTRGRDSFVLVIRPDLRKQGTVLVDRFSRSTASRRDE